MDPHAPALPRLKQSIAGAEQAVAQRSEREAADKQKKDAQTKAQAQQAAAQLQQQQAAAATAAAQALEQQRQAQLAREAEQQRQAAAAAAAAQQQAAQRQAAAAPPPAPAATPGLRAISTPAPRYPAEALRAGTQGEVTVEITVGTDGSVTASRVLTSRPARIFDREAINAVKRWRFEPVGAPVTVRRTLVFNPG